MDGTESACAPKPLMRKCRCGTESSMLRGNAGAPNGGITRPIPGGSGNGADRQSSTRCAGTGSLVFFKKNREGQKSNHYSSRFLFLLTPDKEGIRHFETHPG